MAAVRPVGDIRLIHPHTILVECPFLDAENADTGIVLPFAEALPKVFTTVLKTYKCDEVEEGDTVMFLPNHVQTYLLADGRVIYAIDERSTTTVLEEIL